MKTIDLIKISLHNLAKAKRKYLSSIILLVITIVIFNLCFLFYLGLANSFKSTVADNNKLKIINISSTSNKKVTYKIINELKGETYITSIFPTLLLAGGINFQNNVIPSTIYGINNESIPYYTNGELKFTKTNQIILSDLLKQNVENSSDPKHVKISFQYSTSTEGNIIKGTTEDISLEVIGYYHEINKSEIYGNINYIPLDFSEELYAKSVNISVPKLKSDEEIQGFSVVVDDVSNVKNIAQKIRDLGYNTDYALMYIEALPNIAIAFGIISLLFVSILAISSALLLSSNTSNQIRDRYRDLGILRSLGFDIISLYFILVFELIEVILIAVCVSYLLLNAILIETNTYSRVLFEGIFPGKQFIFEVDLFVFVFSVLVILLICLISTSKNIITVSKTKILNLLRNTG